MTRFPSYSGAGIINYQTVCFYINVALTTLNDLKFPFFSHLFFWNKSWIKGLKTSMTDWWQSASIRHLNPAERPGRGPRESRSVDGVVGVHHRPSPSHLRRHRGPSDNLTNDGPRAGDPAAQSAQGGRRGGKIAGQIMLPADASLITALLSISNYSSCLAAAAQWKMNLVPGSLYIGNATQRPSAAATASTARSSAWISF